MRIIDQLMILMALWIINNLKYFFFMRFNNLSLILVVLLFIKKFKNLYFKRFMRFINLLWILMAL